MAKRIAGAIDHGRGSKHRGPDGEGVFEGPGFSSTLSAAILDRMAAPSRCSLKPSAVKARFDHNGGEDFIITSNFAMNCAASEHQFQKARNRPEVIFACLQRRWGARLPLRTSTACVCALRF
jgi:hypothetical protein